MKIYEIRRICPEAVVLPSDYETYSLLSKRFFEIVRRYTPDVEEYGIDECFADITGLRRPLGMSYSQIAEKIKSDLANELGFTFSVGLGPNKVVAKIGSKWKKPSGLTIIPGYSIHKYLENYDCERVWGIGKQTGSYLRKLGVRTALQLAKKNETWIQGRFTKPVREIWQELNGNFVLELETESRSNRFSIQKVKTFTPPSRNRNFIFSQLSKNIENACIKLRRHGLAARSGIFFLKKQTFQHRGIELRFSHMTAIPSDIIGLVAHHFDRIYEEGGLYRATGTALLRLEEDSNSQLDLFGEILRAEEMKMLYTGVDQVNSKFGKHTLYLGSSFWANNFASHLGERGDLPERSQALLPGEPERKRLRIPMLFAGGVR